MDATRRTVLQKVRGPPSGVPQFVNTGFQVLFHSPPGVLFTFPSQYSALSVTKEYLALRGGPRVFLQGSTCLVVLWILPCLLRFRIRGSHPLSLVFPVPFCYPCRSLPQSEPRRARTPVWALSCSLAATWEIDVSFSSSGYLDVSVHRVPLHTLWIGVWIHKVFLCGFPHSDICGSWDICSSPQLFAAYHVFLRLLVPRHPPCALISLTFRFGKPVLPSPSLHSVGGRLTGRNAPALLVFTLFPGSCRDLPGPRFRESGFLFVRNISAYVTLGCLFICLIF